MKTDIASGGEGGNWEVSQTENKRTIPHRSLWQRWALGETSNKVQTGINPTSTKAGVQKLG